MDGGDTIYQIHTLDAITGPPDMSTVKDELKDAGGKVDRWE